MKHFERAVEVHASYTTPEEHARFTMGVVYSYILRPGFNVPQNIIYEIREAAGDQAEVVEEMTFGTKTVSLTQARAGVRLTGAVLKDGIVYRIIADRAMNPTLLVPMVPVGDHRKIKPVHLDRYDENIRYFVKDKK